MTNWTTSPGYTRYNGTETIVYSVKEWRKLR